MLDAPRARQGDEVAYFDGHRALSNPAAGTGRTFGVAGTSAELDGNVVGNGWFMPGSSVLLTPLFLVDPSAAAETVRVYAGLFTTLLLIAVALLVRRMGRPYAIALLVFPGLVPMWVLLSYTVWGDLIAGLVVAALVAVIVGLARRARDGRAPGILDGARLGSSSSRASTSVRAHCLSWPASSSSLRSAPSSCFGLAPADEV